MPDYTAINWVKKFHLPNWVIECQACLLKIVKEEGNICIKETLSCLPLAFPFCIWPDSWKTGEDNSHFILQAVRVWLSFKGEILQGCPMSCAACYCWNRSVGEVEETLGLFSMGWRTAAAWISLGVPLRTGDGSTFPGKTFSMICIS